MKKNLLKKASAFIMAAFLAAAATGCGSSSSSTGASSAVSGKKTIGVIQFATHPSLDNCYEGFKEGLAEGGFKEGENLTIDFQNAQGETANADMIAKSLAAKNYDMISAIATPVVFTAVNDPVGAQLVKSLDNPGTSCTGSSDVLPLEAQVKMIRAFLPNAKKIGILYTTSEPNSVSMLEKFKGVAANEGFEVVEQGVTNSSEVASGAAALAAKGVDCFNNFTDNNVVNNLSSELQAAKKAGIPVFGSEVEQVKNGCLASQSIDYVALGKQTGLMAAKILKGEATPSDLPVYTVEDATPVYNETVLQEMGLSLPSEYQTAEKVTSAK